MAEAVSTSLEAQRREIAERTRAEVALQAREEDLRTTLDSIGDGVIATDKAGIITRINPPACRLTGWSAEEAIGRPLAEVFSLRRSPPERLNGGSGSSNGPLNAEASRSDAHDLLVARNGGTCCIASTQAAIRALDGSDRGQVVVFRDISAEQALQERLRQSQKMDAIGQLAGGVAHDFNNMLGGIMGSADVLRRHLSTDEKTERYLGIITDAAKRASSLTEKLLSFARRQPATLTGLDVHGVIRDAAALLEHTIDRRIAVRLELKAKPSTVIGDGTLIQTALINLGINAAHAMPQGGDLAIITSVIDLDPAYCRVSPFSLTPGPFIEIEVRDTGCGIPAELIPRIFEPFFTTKPVGQGTGLGLAAVFGTVSQHSGAITVYSEVGRGTSFHIYLPLASATAPREPVPLEPPPRGSGVILVVDDEVAMRAVATDILEGLGYQVVQAEDGQRALDIFQERHNEIALVFLDMIMPRLNGGDCLAAMRRINTDVRVVVSSGFNPDLARMQGIGIRGMIRKPFSASELGWAVHVALRE
jgi:PAS domain S-box-containing protein